MAWLTHIHLNYIVNVSFNKLHNIFWSISLQIPDIQTSLMGRVYHLFHIFCCNYHNVAEKNHYQVKTCLFKYLFNQFLQNKTITRVIHILIQYFFTITHIVYWSVNTTHKVAISTIIYLIVNFSSINKLSNKCLSEIVNYYGSIFFAL